MSTPTFSSGASYASSAETKSKSSAMIEELLASLELDLDTASAQPSLDSISYKPFAATLDDTLETLQKMHPAMAGTLLKLNASDSSPHQGQTWKARFFLLTRDAKLFLFKSAPQPKATAVTYLPISSFTSMSNPLYNSFILQLAGDGIGADGMVTKRTWVLKAHDLNTLRAWLDALNKVALSNAGDSIGLDTFNPISPASFTRNGSIASSNSIDNVNFIPPSMQRSRTSYRDVSSRNRISVDRRNGESSQVTMQPPALSVSTSNGRFSHFSMPNGATEEAMLERRISVTANSGSQSEADKRQAAIAERIAAAKKAREPSPHKKPTGLFVQIPGAGSRF
ncbi:hypothetical protein BCR33DRAFT_723192 [Rhizoclosmatium globosum]|uniref:PH domain-containing protein n=1 Tax=Rhizoclosmatium globosum TaxID=329046 RepID=A0A1Y2BEJ4_9FUNG|nr:hypothetical protein BCR33DRAFT_723192 [Rhizoclosmatium globosum]|eukprot:ORY33184.1 hypothetical protein BCR33DRAFT_723192 [Rhizoclosmatium globosum]